MTVWWPCHIIEGILTFFLWSKNHLNHFIHITVRLYSLISIKYTLHLDLHFHFWYNLWRTGKWVFEWVWNFLPKKKRMSRICRWLRKTCQTPSLSSLIFVYFFSWDEDFVERIQKCRGFVCEYRLDTTAEGIGSCLLFVWIPAE